MDEANSRWKLTGRNFRAHCEPEPQRTRVCSALTAETFGEGIPVKHTHRHTLPLSRITRKQTKKKVLYDFVFFFKKRKKIQIIICALFFVLHVSLVCTAVGSRAQHWRIVSNSISTLARCDERLSRKAKPQCTWDEHISNPLARERPWRSASGVPAAPGWLRYQS